jgi:hypothetical protein
LTRDETPLQAWQAQDQRQQLDDLLSRWHHWRSSYQPVRGYESGGNATDGYRSSRQYDDANGALDDAIERQIMAQVEFQVSELCELHQAAIMSNARGLHCGADVWSHPRLPRDPVQRAEVIRQARECLTRRLLACGVMNAL